MNGTALGYPDKNGNFFKIYHDGIVENVLPDIAAQSSAPIRIEISGMAPAPVEVVDPAVAPDTELPTVPQGTGTVWPSAIAAAGIGVAFNDVSIAAPMPANPRLPVNNGTWTNASRPGNSGWLSTDPRVVAVTEGQPIPFSNDMVDFSPWSQGKLNVPGMTGNSAMDLRLGRDILREQYNLPSDAAVTRWLTSQKLTLHHDVSGVSLDIVPSPLHNNIPHTGGGSILRNWDYSIGSPAGVAMANKIALGGRYLGTAGMVYGAYVWTIAD